MHHPVCCSVTRIADLTGGDVAVADCPAEAWQCGDYVCGEVIDIRGRLRGIELPNGRLMEIMEGDRLIGAWGTRAATLEAVGSWTAIDDGTFEALTPAGLFGKVTSISPFLQPLMRLAYRGHLMRDGRKLTMRGSLPVLAEAPSSAPIVLVFGTSMSAGKTLSGRLIVHLLTRMGLRVVGAKLTGAARYRDVLSFSDAGAVAVLDFVDAGLPSTVCSEEEYRQALGYLMARIAAFEPDVIVAEAGASPLEPYNGKMAMAILDPQIRFELLCAQDPYAVVGVQSAFERKPDLVAGGATNTSAGIELIQKLTGVPGLDLNERASQKLLARLLAEALGL